ncbi:hypothetical protein EVAR_40275_1 [Eumeta japonica]|uniref:Uncharacterized protein n=1 Tax=Eumeta variegata TaxID=151549 RepID=A0A4C1WXT0_EUMVA|nr:hypothetical protein EVAR_40275_1 [Eumeta japonica]
MDNFKEVSESSVAFPFLFPPASSLHCSTANLFPILTYVYILFLPRGRLRTVTSCGLRVSMGGDDYLFMLVVLSRATTVTLGWTASNTLNLGIG